MTERHRAYFYRLITPITALLIYYGVIDDRAAALWAALVGAILTGGLAIANTSTAPPE